MRDSGLKGSFRLSRSQIDAQVSSVSPGIFALGQRSADGAKFTIWRVGRSDADLCRHLHKYVGKYSFFKFDYAESASEAFERECDLFHRFSPQDNRTHPTRPMGTRWRCPRCEIFD